MLLNVTEIVWDMDESESDLPTELTVDTVAEGIVYADAEMPYWLFKRYGWLVKSFTMEPAPTPTLTLV